MIQTNWGHAVAASSRAHRERVVDAGSRSLLSISKLRVSKRWRKQNKKSLLQDKGEHLESPPQLRGAWQTLASVCGRELSWLWGGGVEFEEQELGWSRFYTRLAAQQPIGEVDTKNKKLLERKLFSPPVISVCSPLILCNRSSSNICMDWWVQECSCEKAIQRISVEHLVCLAQRPLEQHLFITHALATQAAGSTQSHRVQYEEKHRHLWKWPRLIIELRILWEAVRRAALELSAWADGSSKQSTCPARVLTLDLSFWKVMVERNIAYYY